MKEASILVYKRKFKDDLVRVNATKFGFGFSRNFGNLTSKLKILYSSSTSQNARLHFEQYVVEDCFDSLVKIHVHVMFNVSSTVKGVFTNLTRTFPNVFMNAHLAALKIMRIGEISAYTTKNPMSSSPNFCER